MRVKLLTSEAQITQMEYNAAYAMLTCHANTNKLNDSKASTFIKKAIHWGHETILEHITLTYEVTDLSRACLLELERHRHISLSVKSTRHTLSKQKTPVLFFSECSDELARIACDYLTKLSEIKAPNDIKKYFMPEGLVTDLIMTVNIRELRHILKLRTAPQALQEFQDLARRFFKVVPDGFKYMLEDCIWLQN